MITVAHIHDSKAAGMLMRVLADGYHNFKTILADADYCGSIIKNAKEKFGYWLQVVLRKEATGNSFKPAHKR